MQIEDLLLKGEQSLFNNKPKPFFNSSPEETEGPYTIWNSGELIYLEEISGVKKRHKTHGAKTYFQLSKGT